MHIKEVLLVTNDLTNARSFYNDKLGFPVTGITQTQISFRIGRSVLTFRELKNSNAQYHLAFSIPNNQLHEALTWIKERAIVLPYAEDSIVADFTNWNAKAFYFRDHDGNILECITHYDRKVERLGSFTKDSFEYITEIGIPVDDVTIACEDFHQHYNIPYFKKGPRLKEFAVMGDEDGMLIVTKTGRGWLPTQEPAGKYPIKIVLEAGTKETIITQD